MPIDTRIIKEVRNGSFTHTGSKDGLKGIIDSQNDAGGYPTMTGGAAPSDSDHDGIPDTWESEHGLNPNSADDRNGTTHSAEGYTNLEMYLSELADDPIEWITTAALPARADVSRNRIVLSTRGLTLYALSGTPVRIDLVDLSGKVCRVIHNGTMRGTSLTIPADRFETGAAGVRLLRVSAATTMVFPLMLVR
jgi:hypothetical protein